MAPETMEERRERQKRLQAIVKTDDPTTWDKAWKEQVTPWDMGEVQPSLREVIEESSIPFPTSGRGLVPGCGTGYDVFYLAKRGLKATGMDISETAVQVANGARNKEPEDVIANSDFAATNFFEHKVADEDRFDLVVDHTFFVAIPPSLRPSWGAQMASLIKPSGYLITIVYPILPKVETGPPHYVRPDHYDPVLGENFTKVWDKTPTKSSRTHEGLEQILVWQRK